jgi:DNA-binding GntR family transcriptional regulator
LFPRLPDSCRQVILVEVFQRMATRTTASAPRRRLSVTHERQLGGVPLREIVFRTLREGIQSGDIKPGDRLREEEVAQRLKVSRTPVREAFGRMVAKGLVEPIGARGLVVRRLDTAEVLELYTMREILEGAAAALAAQHASMPEIDALSDIQAAFEAQKEPSALAWLNRQFHEVIFRAARNRYLDSALQEAQDAIALLGPTTFQLESRLETAIPEHRDIIRHIARHDADAAEQAARLHIRAALRARLRLLHNPESPAGTLAPQR